MEKKRRTTEKYVPEVCEHCGQTCTYALTIDVGTAHFVLALANAVRHFGRNNVHVQKEMERDPNEFASYDMMVKSGHMTSRMQGNASRPRFHGLIAHGANRGEYLITRKGAAFLRGVPVPRTAIVSKVNGHNIGYFIPDAFVTIKEVMKNEPYWWGEFESAALPETESDLWFQPIAMDL